MSKSAASPRVTAIKTPGAPDPEVTTPADGTTQDSTDGAGDQPGEDGRDPAQPTIAPDLEALIAQKVAEGIAKERARERKASSGPGLVPAVLPTQDEAYADVKRTQRSVLTKDGFLTLRPEDDRKAKRDRDVNGFAKD